MLFLLLFAQHARAQINNPTPPPSLPASIIGTSVLLSPTNAATFYSDSTWTDQLQKYTLVPTPVPTEITETARALKSNVDLIYGYVRNNIENSWMYGQQKGALGALIDKYGTSFDQADLMVQLLRVNNAYTANFQIGTIDPTPAQFTAWTGISDAKEACQMLANGGIPGTVNGTGNTDCSNVSGSISAVTMSHIWVQVSIGGTNYLFDPSYKQHIKIAPINLASAINYSGYSSPLATAKTNMTSTTFGSGTVQGRQQLNSLGLNTLIQNYATNLLTYLYSNNLSSAHMEDIVGGGVIVPDTPPAGGWRQTSLPYVQSTSATWTGNIPNSWRTKLGINIQTWNWNGNGSCNGQQSGSWAPVFNDFLYVDQIYGRKLDVVAGVPANDFYGSTVVISLDGAALDSFTQPGIFCGTYNPYGYPLRYSARGGPTYITLSATHPYAAATDGSTHPTGGYMTQTVTMPAPLSAGLTIVDGFGDAGPKLYTKWESEGSYDTAIEPIGLFPCPQPRDGICGDAFTGTDGGYKRERLAANWLAQSTRAARLHAAIGGGIVQLHHALGLSFADTSLSKGYLDEQDMQTENPQFTLGDTVDRLNVVSGFSVEHTSNTSRRAIVHAIAATSAALEGSTETQGEDVPDSASTATRFEWGNAPPGTAGNWDATSCNQSTPAGRNSYEDPGCPGARWFVQYDSTNYGQAANVVQIETHPLGWYNGKDGSANKGDQPNIGSGEATIWSNAYASEVTAYADCGTTGHPACTAAPQFTVVTSQEAFLGPGQRGGGNVAWLADTYTHAPTRERGPALVATAYNQSGDPVAIAHAQIGITGAFGNWPDNTFLAIKGGGAGSLPDQNVQYDPSVAADILKAHFVDKSNLFGVNLSNGAMGYTAPGKIDVGNGGFPYELTADYEWNPEGPIHGAPPASPIRPGRGWTTNWNNSLSMSGSGMEAMGQSDVRAAVGTIAAFYAEQDIYSNPQTIERDVAGLLTQAWWVRQIQANVVTVQMGATARQFLGLPQTVTLPNSQTAWFTPGPGEVSTLVMTGGARTANEHICQPAVGSKAPYALDRGWDYSGVWNNTQPAAFTVTNPHGDTQSFVNWTNTYSTSDYDVCGFGQGFRLSSWSFPQGTSITFDYGNAWDPMNSQSGAGFDQLLDVKNSNGRQINFSSDVMANLVSFTDGSRTVSLVVNDNIVTGITDARGKTTSFGYLFPRGVSSTQRPCPFNDLFQVFTPEKPLSPNIQYDWDSECRVKDIRDAENLQVGDRQPWNFFIADGTRGERDDPLNDAWSVTYDIYGHPMSYSDEDGDITQAAADGRGRIMQYLYPEGDCDVLAYDDNNNTTSLSKVDAASSCNTGAGSTHVLTATATWDQTINKPLTVFDFNGNKTTFTYYPNASCPSGGGNGATLLCEVTRPKVNNVNPVYTFTYNGNGRLLNATDPVTASTSITTCNTYDSGTQNLLTTTVDCGTGELNLETQFGYDSIGNLTSMIDPRESAGASNGGSWTYSFDADRHKTESDHHDGGTGANLNAASRTIYDDAGRDIEEDVGTAFSGSGVQSWAMNKITAYTPTWKVASITDGDNRMTSTAYDPADRVSTVTDPVWRETGFTYDPAGNVLTELRAYGTQIQETYATYTYCTAYQSASCSTATSNGGNGEKTSVFDADGSSHMTTYSYDAFVRPHVTTFPDTTTESIPTTANGGYDANGNVLVRNTRANCQLSYAYDNLNRMTTKTLPACHNAAADTISFTFDLGGRRTGYSDTLTNAITLGNDTAGRLTSITDSIAGGPQNLLTQYSLDQNGNRSKLTWPDSYYVGYCYDSLNRMLTAQANATDCLSCCRFG